MAPVTRTCPSCQKSIAVPPEAIGKKVRCSGCQAVFRIDDDGMSPASMSIEAPAPWDLSKPAVQPQEIPAPAPPPIVAGEFDFGTPSTESDQPSNLDFSGDDNQLNAGVRLRINRVCNVLTFGGVMTVFLAICTIIRGFLISGRTGNPFSFFGSVAAASVLMTFAVFILIGARSFAALGSKGLAMTGAVLSLAAAALGALGAISAIFGFFDLDMQMFSVCCLGSTSFIQVPSCLWGGIGSLLLVNLPATGEAFQHERERRQRVAERSGGFVPELAMQMAGLHAAMWMGGLCLAIIILIAMRVIVLWRLSGMNQADPNAITFDIVVSTLLFVCVIAIMLGAVSLFRRLSPIPGFVASGLCILMAILSFCGTFASLPGLLRMQDSIVRSILGASVFVLIAMLVLSVICAFVGFSASNLLVRYRAALAKQVEPKDEREQDRNPENAI